MARPVGNLAFLCFVLFLPVTTQHRILPSKLKEQIVSRKADVNRIIDYVLNSRRSQAYDRLAELGDKFGHRMTGSESLERAINFTVDKLRDEGFENVHTEPVQVPKWNRGKEWVKMLKPRELSMPMLGLGMSVGTNGSVLEADVIVVNSFDELRKQGENNVTGKIVVYNQEWVGYSNTVVYRRAGASEAARLGAVGALVRSLTSFSLVTPHTGVQNYQPNVTKIPVACITVEDAEMLSRIQRRGERIRIQMYMEAEYVGETESRNVVAEITGTQFPDSVIILGGHIDSWDVGSGSMDDGAGVMIAWQALSVIQQLQLKPRRTVRLVLWTAEEQGIYGGKQYFNQHKNDVDKVSLIIESDHGAMTPKGIRFRGCNLAKGILEETCSMLTAINATEVLEASLNQIGADTKDWVGAGVPGIELYSANENYFHYHHTEADTLGVMNANDLDLCTILWATITYVVGNLDDNLPRQGDLIPVSKASGYAMGHVGVVATFATIVIMASR